MDNNILEALEYIDPSTLDYNDWLSVGLSLKYEGYDWTIWDSWSQNDKRYRKGECERKWKTFTGSLTPITGATIYKLAKEKGYVQRLPEEGCMEWNDVIECDEDGDIYTLSSGKKSSSQLIEYLETLFNEDEFVGYVTNDVWKDDNEYKPKRGCFDRTQKELVSLLRKHEDDIGAVIGDTKNECGAWIRFNPLDGTGASDKNITRFSYALVESDEMPLSEQEAMYRKLELPIACLVYSGKKSLHAIVRVDAPDIMEYRKRVQFLYDFLDKHNVKVDRANRNPSRLSRMPGIMRNDKMQTLLAVNIGRKSWNDWMDYVEGETDELAEFEYPSDLFNNRPPLSPELIGGVLRLGHKMIVSGASKSAKSFFLIELAIAITEGRDFLGFKCMKGNVLYINLEIDRASCMNRVFTIYDALSINKPNARSLVMWNLRGHAMPLDKFVPKIVRKVAGSNIKVIIIDPIYKVITGDENSASEMGYFCNQFDKICNETGCSIIYAHHHSKGAQAGKVAQDRSSGSGVFARDPDAIIDMVELDLSEEIMNKVADKSTDTAWQMELVTRDFAQPKARKIWFKYPLHILDEDGYLNNSFGKGDPRRNLKQYKDGKVKTDDEKKEILLDAFDAVSLGKTEIDIKDLAEYLSDGSEDGVEKARKKIYKWKKELGCITISDGIVKKA